MSGFFFKRSKEVVKRFLQTAVIVDDRASFGGSSVPSTAAALKSPGKRVSKNALIELSTTAEPKAHDLDVGALIESFASEGIVCAALKPEKASQKIKEADLATQRADIVILDWWTDGEDAKGDLAKKLLTKILETDKPTNGRTSFYSRRLRLVAVYTGETELDEIAQEIKTLLDKLSWTKNVKCSQQTVKAWPVIVKVYGKKGTLVGGSRLREDELPDILIRDFTEMTSGLLSNVALEALSAIRTNTHRILNRFQPSLDAPYLAHRVLSNPPQEAEGHPLPWIASEIEGILADDKQIVSLVKQEPIEEWLDDSKQKLKPQAVGLKSLESVVWAMKELTKLGAVSSYKKTKKKSYKEDRPEDTWAEVDQLLKNLGSSSSSLDERARTEKLTQALGAGDENDDIRFALLTSLRSQYEAPAPVLKLGTIVVWQEKQGSEQSSYLLCVQPLCDSVRIGSKKIFPFIPLKKTNFKDTFDLVVPRLSANSTSYLRLKCDYKFHRLVLIEMKSKSRQCVEATKNEQQVWQFEPADEKSFKLNFIADLKPDHANRIADRLTNEISRVGLTESEWLRRQAR